MNLKSSLVDWFELNIREGFRILPSSAFKKAFIGGTCSFTPFILSLSGGTMGGAIGDIFRVAEYIGYLFSVGFPMMLIASLLFASEKSRKNLIQSALEKEKPRFAPLFAAYSLFSCLMMVWAIFFGLVSQLVFTGSAGGAVFIPYLIAVALPMTLLLCPITVLVTLAMDGWKSAIAVGAAIFIGLGIATGQPHYPVRYPEVAFFGPAHTLVATLYILVTLFGNPLSAVYYVGVSFTPFDLVFPLSVFIVVSTVSYVASKRFLISNLRRWIAFSGEWETKLGSIPRLDERSSTDDPSKLKEGYQFRRKTVAAVVAVFVILVPLMSSGYATIRRQEWRTVVYESPPGGESVEIGTWLIGSFQGIEGGEHTDLCVTCEGQLHGGVADAGYVNYTFRKRQMTLSELEQMNETEMEHRFGRGWGYTSLFGSNFDTGCSGPISNVEYVWVFRFNDVGGKTAGRITVTLRIVIQDSPF
ncbi:MAG: hypothetical protein KGY80_11135 [Candidatus Thorarchaeota archaeon]|nr:hypothetical protein [Candidatus Thorarchaeota archaeon]